MYKKIWYVLRSLNNQKQRKINMVTQDKHGQKYQESLKQPQRIPGWYYAINSQKAN